jgi:hypothetical protein
LSDTVTRPTCFLAARALDDFCGQFANRDDVLVTLLGQAAHKVKL